MKLTIPSHLHNYFWGDNVEELDWDLHKKYIIQTVLDKGNSDAIHWLFTHTNKEEINSLLPSLKLQPKSSNFWQIYLS